MSIDECRLLIVEGRRRGTDAWRGLGTSTIRSLAKTSVLLCALGGGNAFFDHRGHGEAQRRGGIARSSSEIVVSQSAVGLGRVGTILAVEAFKGKFGER
jgi:hypothetical protein